MDEIPLSLILAASVVIAAFLTLVQFSLLRLKRTKLKALLEIRSDEDWLQFWLRRSEKYWLTSIVMGAATKVLAAVTSLALIDRIWGIDSWPPFIISFAVASVTILVLTEMLPRSIGRAYGERCARFTLRPMQVITVLSAPITLPSLWLIRAFAKLFNVRESLNPVADFDEDILDILETSEKSTELEEDEKELISSVVEFTDTIAREVMVPRVDVVALDNKATIKDVHEKIMQTGHSRIPIYEDTIDNILGVFYVKDLLKYVNRNDIDKHLAAGEMHDPIFVPETKNVNDLLQEFQQKKMNVAIVVDEYGGTAGLITIKDILEEIVGEMQDEDETEEVLFTALPDGGYLVNAKMTIDELEEDLNIKVPESSEYETIGGFIYTSLGKIPHKDEVLQRNGVFIKIVEVDDRRIHRVLLKPISEGSE